MRKEDGKGELGGGKDGQKGQTGTKDATGQRRHEWVEQGKQGGTP